MKVKFLTDVETKVGNRNNQRDPGVKPERFKAGQVVELSEASANHWINRGKAEAFVAGPAPFGRSDSEDHTTQEKPPTPPVGGKK